MATKTKKIRHQERAYKCDDCGKVSDEVVRENCPYNEDIYGIQVKVKLCPKCHNERVADI
jgi:Zn finger protein HypA/HybF involved in hydrogenase expression